MKVLYEIAFTWTKLVHACREKLHHTPVVISQ
jgi:hypothetical protein